MRRCILMLHRGAPRAAPVASPPRGIAPMPLSPQRKVGRVSSQGGSHAGKAAAVTASADASPPRPIPQRLARHFMSNKNLLVQPQELNRGSVKMVWWSCANPKCKLHTEGFKRRTDEHCKLSGACPECNAVPAEGQVANKSLQSKKGAVLPHTAEERNLQPILAYPWDKNEWRFNAEEPLLVSPKLDGVRCIAWYSLTLDRPVLYSRLGNPFTSCPHILNALLPLFKADKSLVFDGELYMHKLADNFEKIVGAVKTQNENFKDDETRKVAASLQYHVFDTMYARGMEPDAPFALRVVKYLEAIGKLPAESREVVVPVQHEECRKADVAALMAKYSKAKYEGAMVRSASSPYEHTRTYSLQKVKTMADAEFKLLRLQEGKGRLRGSAGNAVLVSAKGVEFSASLSLDDEAKQRWWKRRGEIEGANLMATVQYQNMSAKGVPRFPILKAVRGKADGSDWV